MPLFSELEDVTLGKLLEYFSSDTHYNTDPEERDLWLQEVAVRIAKSGSEGLNFLIQSISEADQPRLRAILLSFSLLPAAIANDRRGELKRILVDFLKSKDMVLIAEAIEALNCLGFAEVVQDILPFLAHKSPYVAGSALRFLSRHYPERAKPILLESLHSEDPIIRQNAIDELDRLNCSEALPYLRLLLHDENEYVRQAAQTAITSLETVEEQHD